MIYIKRTLWLLGYPIMWSLVSVLFIIAFAFIGFGCLFQYIKNGAIQDCGDCLRWCIKIVYWYNDIEFKD